MLSAGALVLPRFANSKTLFATNSKLNIALIGGGGIARSCYNDCMDENVVAIADVDDVSGVKQKSFSLFNGKDLSGWKYQDSAPFA